jgi:hypothetical protein
VELSQEQLTYAALDAWAPLQVYNALLAMQVPAPVSFDPLPAAGLDVFLYQVDRIRIIAKGQILVHPDNKFDGINLSKTRALIDIKEVYVPGAVITNHRARTLESFGAPPFSVVALKSQVYSFVDSFIPAQEVVAAQSLDPLTESEALESIPDADNSEDISDRDFQGLNIGFEDPCPETQLGDSDHSPRAAHPDTEGLGSYQEFLSMLKDTPWPTQVRSRVLKDIFHVFQMIHTRVSKVYVGQPRVVLR